MKAFVLISAFVLFVISVQICTTHPILATFLTVLAADLLTDIGGCSIVARAMKRI